ncbi:MAG: nickel-dependent hydrogenase large subunit [Campylobacterales bacterium]|nr:nickel-dependent hydrogenase large subunit [Campylobacterales bacterium]
MGGIIQDLLFDTNVHYRAVEDAYGIALPPNAENIRNLVTLALFVQDHIVHYYHLHYVDVVSAISTEPDKAAELAQTYHDYPYCTSTGHSAYRFTPEQNLIHINHYLEVLRVVHSFDPCLACAVHVINAKGRELSHYKIAATCTL